MAGTNVWDSKSVEETAAGVGLTRGADSHLSDDVRFVREARGLLDLVRERHGTENAAPSVVLLRRERDGPAHETATSHSRLHNGATDLSGRLWVVGAAVTSGTGIDLPSGDTDDIFRFIRDELQLGDWPAVYYDTAASPPVVAWYPAGLNRDEFLYEGQLGRPSLDVAEVMTTVKNVHSAQLRTTLNQPRSIALWEDGAKHFAHSDAEAHAQVALISGLSALYARPFVVDQETSGHTGRYDIGIRERVAVGTTRLHVILELKVTRSFSEGGTPYTPKRNEENVVSGVKQAYSYAAEREAGAKACVVFDLRNDDDCVDLPEAQRHADDLDVLLEVLRCFPTSADVRDDLIASRERPQGEPGPAEE